ncbi:MAG: hypothetical protein KBD83_07620 [Gammaproteobacteria bacterium]|nr:hypothetical protein [Gammaproteobacteria bacterium]
MKKSRMIKLKHLIIIQSICLASVSFAIETNYSYCPQPSDNPITWSCSGSDWSVGAESEEKMQAICTANDGAIDSKGNKIDSKTTKPPESIRAYCSDSKVSAHKGEITDTYFQYKAKNRESKGSGSHHAGFKSNNDGPDGISCNIDYWTQSTALSTTVANGGGCDNDLDNTYTT